MPVVETVETSMLAGVVVVEGLDHSGVRRRQEFESHSATCDCAPGVCHLPVHNLHLTLQKAQAVK